MTTSLEKVQLTTLLARKPPSRTKPSKKRLQQLKKDRERTAAISNYIDHHREALLGSLEPRAKRSGILRLGRRWFHGESEAVQQSFFAGKSGSWDVGACPLERGGGSAAVASCARQPSPKICAPAARSPPRAAEPAVTKKSMGPIGGVGPATAALEPTESAVAEAASLAAIGPIGGIVSTVAAQAPAGSLDATVWQKDLVGHLPAMVVVFRVASKSWLRRFDWSRTLRLSTTPRPAFAQAYGARRLLQGC